MKIPWDFDNHRNMCISGEIMITTPLRRDCKKEMKAEGRVVGKIWGLRDREQIHRETQGREEKPNEVWGLICRIKA